MDGWMGVKGWEDRCMDGAVDGWALKQWTFYRRCWWFICLPEVICLASSLETACL